MKPYWVTFYSYKGGVGRSLALANTAALLVRNGRRVLLIDFDLEAPGLDSFSEFHEATGQKGVVEYVSQFLTNKVAPDLREFVHDCQLPEVPRGKLWVMPAGRRDMAYNRLLAHLNWAELYESGFGAPFFANWKAAVEQHFEPDYVFVDSRTGLTEIGGVCTTQFPDLVMLLFSLNDQNINGIATVAKSIRDSGSASVPQMHFVVTPVPNIPAEDRVEIVDGHPRARQSLLAERFETASTRLGVKLSSRVHYYAPACLAERLFVLDDELMQPVICDDYERLCDEIAAFNRNGIDYLEREAESAIEVRDKKRIERLEAILERDFAGRPEAVFLRAKFAVESNAIERAIALASEALHLDPAYEPPANFIAQHFDRSDQIDAECALYKELLSYADRLSDERIQDIGLDLARTLMVLGRYAEAEEVWQGCVDYSKAQNLTPSLVLPTVFNFAEARRRRLGGIDRDVWFEVIRLFVEAGENVDGYPPEQANRLQAVHIAYACVGEVEEAKAALERAKRVALAAGEIDDIFTVSRYRNVPAADFISDVDRMLASLDRGELWDGMKLPEIS